MPTAIRTKEEVLADLTHRINVALEDFQSHSFTCRPCRNPIETYEARQNLCDFGANLAAEIARLLYKKAEYTKSGVFDIIAPYSFQAADGLINMIAHNKQGAYSNTIVDLKRARPQTEAKKSTQHRRIESSSEPRYIPTPAPAARGSGYAEDQQRLCRKEHRASAEYINPRDYSTYGNPNTSYNEIQKYAPQAPSSNGDTHSDSKLSSGQRSVKFKPTVLVREYEV